jgi:C-terminal processing protease CtpA/Prc
MGPKSRQIRWAALCVAVVVMPLSLSSRAEADHSSRSAQAKGFARLGHRQEILRKTTNVEVGRLKSGMPVTVTASLRVYRHREQRTVPITKKVRKRRSKNLLVARHYKHLGDLVYEVDTYVRKLPPSTPTREPVERTIRLTRELLEHARDKHLRRDEIDWSKMANALRQTAVEVLPDRFGAHEPVAKGPALPEGFGLGIKIVMRRGKPTIGRAFRNGPAAKAGLKKNDVITHVDGAAVADMDQALARIHASPNRTVELGIERGRKASSIEVKRGLVDRYPAKTELREGIGYVRLGLFEGQKVNLAADKKGSTYIKRYGDPAEQEGIKLTTLFKLDKAIERLYQRNGKKKLEGLVLDLRGNMGGELENAKAVLNRFLSSGKLLELRGQNGDVVETHSASASGAAYKDMPLVVLVDGGSYSSSELVAGALQVAGRAVVLGKKTGGKGTVLSGIPLADRSTLRLTTHTYHLADGKTPDLVGITPDIAYENSRQWFRGAKGKKRGDYVKEHAFDLLKHGKVPLTGKVEQDATSE